METRGDWLRDQIERRKITVRQIADALDVTTKTVYDWQNGKTVINEDRVPRLAEVLGLSEVDARRGLGFWVPEPTAQDRPQLRAVPTPDNPYTDPAERAIWAEEALSEDERRAFIDLLRARRRAASG